ncbi:hypothetical protein BDW62DRAFT_203730 [Aspergillus aurantiobrunneus]
MRYFGFHTALCSLIPRHPLILSRARTGVISAAVILISTVLAAPQCISSAPNGPLRITPDCVDSTYNTPVITGEADEPHPVPHRRVSGYFKNTTVDFNLYFPPAEAWAGRFFQLVYPHQSSTAEDKAIAFGVDSGAYTIHVGGSTGYRGDAAAAKFSKQVAREYYANASRQIYGYIYGGSGGSLQTIGAMENTEGVWDGAVALIQAIPMSIPDNYVIRSLAGIVLDAKAPSLVDAVSPGGSGDPFAGLEPYERLVLDEVTALGLPLNAWEDFDGVARNRTGLWNSLRAIAIPTIQGVDPGYVHDFWNTEGYLGTEDSDLGQFFRNRLVEYEVTVQEVQRGQDDVPVGMVVDGVPAESPDELEFTILRQGQELGSFFGLIDQRDGSVYIYSESNATVLANLAEGVQLQADNRWYLAVHTWHRHQVPPVAEGYYGYNFLRDADGDPIYPQRELLLAPSVVAGASGGGTHTGDVKGKVIVMDNLVDFDAFPWHADWYRSQVQAALGDRFGDNYRIFYNEHADHFLGAVPHSQQTRVVEFTGLYEQLLRDLSAWTEAGIEPPKQTQYEVQNGQVVLPTSASERGGIQPLVTLTVDNGNKTTVAPCETVSFSLQAEVPPGTGEIISIEWDWEGTRDFANGTLSETSQRVDIQTEHKYDTPGTYMPAVRVASHREGDIETPFARALNLGRVRVVVVA